MATIATLIGQKIASYRKKENISQKKLAANLSPDNKNKVSQTRVSEMERGIFRPFKKNPTLQAHTIKELSKLIDVPIPTMDMLYSGAKADEDQLILSDQRDCIDRLGGLQHATIWILVSGTLPVERSAHFRREWQKNILQGCRYNLVWLCDWREWEQVRRTFDQTREICLNLINEAGSNVGNRVGIVHFFVFSDGISKGYRQSMVYQTVIDIARECESIPYADAHIVEVETGESENPLLLWYKYFSPFYAIVYYHPRESVKKGLAVLSFSNVEMRPSGFESERFRFASSVHTSGLRSLTARLLDKATKSRTET